MMLCMLVDSCVGLKFCAVPSQPTCETLRSRSWVIDFKSKRQASFADNSCYLLTSLAVRILGIT